jgi:PTS system N-acetylglucosamine-specific IIC component
VVVGPTADLLASEIREAMASMTKDSPKALALGAMPHQQHSGVALPSLAPAPPVAPASTAEDAPTKDVLQGLIAALGGRANVRNIEAASSRLRIAVAHTSAVDITAIRKLGMRGAAIAAADSVHVIVGPAAEAAGASLREVLAS